MPVNVSPFSGVRYASDQDMALLHCPPYDVISPEEQERLYEKSPFNAVHLELARDDYGNVGEAFKQWVADGVLVRDDRDSFYVYRQDFVAGDRTRRRVAGVIGALELQEFGDSAGVLPHERTMPGPKKDRLALLRACPVNLSPIFAIYRGAGGLVPYFDDLENRPTAARFVDDAGTLHRLWAITSPAELKTLHDALEPGPLVIADGHHRYETALEYRNEQSGRGGHDSIMTFCVDADAEGLVVLPYNRAFRTSISDEELTRRLRDNFDTRPIDPTDRDGLMSSRSDHPLIFLLGDTRLLVEVDDDRVVAAIGRRAPAWRALDVVALHEVVLPAVVPEGIDEFMFSKDPDEIVGVVGTEEWSGGVLLRPLTAPLVVDVARSGERMPQKASYFWPKAITGLVFRPLD